MTFIVRLSTDATGRVTGIVERVRNGQRERFEGFEGLAPALVCRPPRFVSEVRKMQNDLGRKTVALAAVATTSMLGGCAVRRDPYPAASPATTVVVTQPAPAQRVVTYPEGRYELRGRRRGGEPVLLDLDPDGLHGGAALTPMIDPTYFLSVFGLAAPEPFASLSFFMLAWPAGFIASSTETRSPFFTFA